MTRNDISDSDFSTIDAGKLLPGCSVPILVPNEPSCRSVHAFREFQSLPIDGLSSTAMQSLTDSLSEVAESLAELHQMHRCVGHITSTSFHNRGSSAEPRATLWIDPSRADQADAVHSGDPESMYWTAARLQSNAPATSADDWYAMGIVLAEIALSSAAVHKIWELSRKDGEFVPSLIQNLRRSRRNKRLTKMAVELIREGAQGKVEPVTVAKMVAPRQKGISKAGYVSVGFTTVALLLVLWNSYADSVAREARGEAIDQRDEQIAMLKGQTAELQGRLEVLQASAVRAESTMRVSSNPPTPVARSSDRDRWAADVAGRSLEQAIESSQDFQPAAWREILRSIQAIPGQQQWRTRDQSLRRSVQMIVDAPWDQTQIEQTRERLTSLNQAHSRWSAWARSSRSVEEIRTQHELMRSGLVKDFLGQWLAETLEVRSFDLRTRIVSAGEGNTFLAHLIGFETPSDSESLSWAWASTDGSGESIEMQVDEYRAGQSLSFWLQQDSSIPLWNSTVIEHTLDSPLLAWRLTKGLKLEDSESGYAVLLSTNKRFGPPVTLDQSTSSVGIIEKKKVVDPMDSLPL